QPTIYYPVFTVTDDSYVIVIDMHGPIRNHVCNVETFMNSVHFRALTRLPCVKTKWQVRRACIWSFLMCSKQDQQLGKTRKSSPIDSICNIVNGSYPNGRTVKLKFAVKYSRYNYY